MTRVATLAANSTEPVTLQFIPYRDIAIAPENLRARGPANAGIPRLADTIWAVGVLVPLLVRAGEKKDPKGAMALDCRRRLLALATIIEAGVIADDYPVPVIFACDRARQVAAAVLANDERVLIRVADVILAIGKLRRRRFDTAAIADDILVHFDDGRSTATLDLLADFCRTIQVLLFSHHKSIRHAAERLVSEGRANVVDLDGPSGRAE